MKRVIINELEEWKNSPNRKPLLLTGARQVGKTWAMNEFGKSSFKSLAYLSIDSSERFSNMFNEITDPHVILSAIQAETGVRINPRETLVVLDEIQEEPNAINSLKYFCEQAQEYHIIGAGSTLGVMLHNHESFPVGKVQFLHLNPMGFFEFLEANSEGMLKEYITLANIQKPHPFHEKLNRLLKEYLFVGGMPESVKEFSLSHDYVSTRQIQKDINEAYIRDFSKYSSAPFATKLRLVWESIPAQLSKENKRFLFSLLRNSARAIDFETQIEWLKDSSLISKTKRVSKPGYPLKAYEEFGIFKIFMHDLGIFGALSGTEANLVLENSKFFTENKGSQAEQYVHQQLSLIYKKGIYYWSNETGRAEIDFLIQHESGESIPIEVKSGFNLKSKSLGVFMEKYDSKFAIRTSLSNFKINKESKIIDLPLYALELLPEVLEFGEKIF